jgi:hypothetical protein
VCVREPKLDLDDRVGAGLDRWRLLRRGSGGAAELERLAERLRLAWPPAQAERLPEPGVGFGGCVVGRRAGALVRLDLGLLVG